jgi:FixJ family two-component response regulator
MNAWENKYVAVVAEDEAICQTLARLVISAGYAARTFACGQDFLAEDPLPGPCCLIVDLNMPRLDGFDLQQELTGRTEQIVFLTAHGDVQMCARAMKLGAIDFLCKPVDDGVLLDAVTCAIERSAEMVSVISDRDAARGRLARFTPREREVFERVIKGMLNKQIAVDLGIAEKTIKIHRGRMMRKAGVVCVPDLVRLAIAAGQAPYAVSNKNGVMREPSFTTSPKPQPQSCRDRNRSPVACSDRCSRT